jgi:plasmid maintenance system antidote protein VapI
MKPETEHLKKLMELKGWKQVQTAEALGVSQPTIQRLLKESVPMHGSMKVLIEKLIEEAEQSLAADLTSAGENHQ